jgi:hypothetical protein
MLSPAQERIQILESMLNNKNITIEDLKFQKNALSREIDELIDRVKCVELEKESEFRNCQRKIEELEYRERENEQLIQSLQQELEATQRQLCSRSAKQSLSGPDGLQSLFSENKTLKSSAEAANSQFSNGKADSKAEFVIFKLQEQIKQLQEANENLALSLETRPTVKDLKDKDFEIAELREKLSKRQSRSRSASQPRDKSRVSIQKDRELHSLPLGELPSVPTMNILLTDLLQELRVEQFGDILAVVKRLKKKAKGSDLEEKLGRLVKDLSPEGSFHPMPSPQQSWKWIRRVVEEYLALKKDLEREEKNKAIVNRLMGALGIVDSGMIGKEVARLIGESHANRALREKISLVVERDPRTLLKDFKHLADEII